ncbi:MAG: hypothetical protein ACJ0RQ_09170 [Candidatus Azotimanducaceae bacterium]
MRRRNGKLSHRGHSMAYSARIRAGYLTLANSILNLGLATSAIKRTRAESYVFEVQACYIPNYDRF